MPDDGFNLRYALMYFRRVCTVAGVLDANRLRSYADQIAAQAMEETVILSNTFEGGSASAAVKFPKAIAGTAVEQLLLEADQDAPRLVDQTQASFRSPYNPGQSSLL